MGIKLRLFDIFKKPETREAPTKTGIGEAYTKTAIGTEDKCPHCSAKLDAVPVRKKKCPHCGLFIYVRTRPLDRKRVLVTEDDAKKIDDEWTCYQLLKRYNSSEKEYQDVEKELSQKFQNVPLQEDVIWTILNQRLLAAMKYNDWHQMKMLYLEQARILYEHDREFFKPLQESARCDLLAYKSSGVNKVEILTARDDSCEKCNALNGKIFTVKKALEIMPIPVSDCAKGWCRCCYLPVVD